MEGFVFGFVVAVVVMSFLTPRTVTLEEITKASDICVNSSSALDYAIIGPISSDAYCKNGAVFKKINKKTNKENAK